MKKLILIVFLLNNIICYSQITVIYGNVAAPDVNIQEITTLVGTSSDKNGDFKLKVYTEDVTLHFSCIGYADTIISLNSNDFHNGEALIGFKMRQISYDLPTAEISASKHFYQTKSGVNIADISFIDDKILVLENKKSKSKLIIIDNYGDKINYIRFDSLYNEIYIDFFNNYILVGDNFCQQIHFDTCYTVQNVANFSRKDFEEKLRIGVRKFGDSFIFKDKPLIINNNYVRRDHNKSVGYFYINPNDSVVERKQICRFVDEEGYKNAAALFAEIISLYHAFTEEHEDLIKLGFWDGNLMSILPQPCGPYNSEEPCGWQTRCFVKINQYIKLDAKQLNINVFDKDSTLYFIYLDEMKLLSFDKNFNKIAELPITINTDKKFQNTIIEDHASNQIYGIFVNDGIYYLANLNLQNATFENPVKASNKIYPNILKINNNKIYTSYFNAEKQLGFIDIMEL